MSPIEILENLISRLNNLFTVQTQEVIPELNKIKELLEQKPQEKPVVIVAEKDIINEEVKQELIEENNITEKAMEYLKSKWVKGLHFYKDDKKIISKAISLWFIQ